MKYRMLATLAAIAAVLVFGSAKPSPVWAGPSLSVTVAGVAFIADNDGVHDLNPAAGIIRFNSGAPAPAPGVPGGFALPGGSSVSQVSGTVSTAGGGALVGAVNVVNLTNFSAVRLAGAGAAALPITISHGFPAPAVAVMAADSIAGAFIAPLGAAIAAGNSLSWQGSVNAVPIAPPAGAIVLPAPPIPAGGAPSPVAVAGGHGLLAVPAPPPAPPPMVLQGTLSITLAGAPVGQALTLPLSAEVGIFYKPAAPPLPSEVACPSAPSGQRLDAFNDSEAKMTVRLTNPDLGTATVDNLSGRTCVFRDSGAQDVVGVEPPNWVVTPVGDGQDEVRTEIVAMLLTGTGTFGGVPFRVTVIESPFEQSIGLVEETTGPQDDSLNGTPFESFFDVFVYVYVDVGIDDTIDFVLKNLDPVKMSTDDLTQLPPQPGAEYKSKNQVALFDESKKERGILIQETHTPGVPKKIGGIAVDPDAGALPLESAGSAGANAGVLAGVIATVTASAVALAGAAWYARRRCLP